MDLKQAVMRCLRDKYADFGGRAGRSEFWYFMLAWFLASLVLGALRVPLLALLVNLGLLLPGLAVSSRRLHDVGKSGWFQLVGLIPILGFILVLYWLTLPSTGPNEFGEGPAPADAPTGLPPGAV
jgi:uncharacterized membrane protein YhaH (DUF805 family)